MTSLVAAENNEAVLIAYGSNMFSGHKTASQAFAHLVKTLRGRGVQLARNSQLWRSQAWPDPSDPPFVNAVIQVKTHIQPYELITLLHDVEREFGRVRPSLPNAPRVLDLDLIAYGRLILNGENGLILPHPRSHGRAFVMGPLAQILPEWLHPVLQRTAAELYKDAKIGVDAYPVDEEV